jgi:hypothetical protein
MRRHLIARMLRPVRAGERKTAWHHPAVSSADKTPVTLVVTSPAFADGTPISQRHAGTGVGDNISPALSWDGVPDGTVELVLVIEDPDVPMPRPIVHGLATGIDPELTELAEGALNVGGSAGARAVGDDEPQRSVRIGVGAFKRRGYAGPRPIPGHGAHRYVFQLFALDAPSGLDETATLTQTLRAIRGHVIARGRLTGTYQRD